MLYGRFDDALSVLLGRELMLVLGLAGYLAGFFQGV